MAVYKVIQNVEAEDKLVGPLTLRQFVYAMIAAGILWLGYVVVAAGAWFITIPLLPFFGALVFFAFPWSKDQPTEVWALARIRFLFKPRKRIWNQSGIKELVTITAPKQIERTYSDGLSPDEVRGRLRALAETVDSRGWSTRRASNMPSAIYISPVVVNAGSSDRLIDASNYTQSAPVVDNEEYEDIFDPSGSSMARQFDNMLYSAGQQRHNNLMQQMQQNQPMQNTTQPQPSADYWFMHQPQSQPARAGEHMFGAPQTVQATQAPQSAQFQPSNPAPAPLVQDDSALLEQLRASQQNTNYSYAHLPTVLPIAEQEKIAQAQREAAQQQPSSATEKPTDKPVTSTSDAAILELAQNDDLNIATIARQAKRNRGEDPDEVVISLH